MILVSSEGTAEEFSLSASHEKIYTRVAGPARIELRFHDGALTWKWYSHWWTEGAALAVRDKINDIGRHLKAAGAPMELRFDLGYRRRSKCVCERARRTARPSMELPRRHRGDEIGPVVDLPCAYHKDQLSPHLREVVDKPLRITDELKNTQLPPVTHISNASNRSGTAGRDPSAPQPKNSSPAGRAPGTTHGSGR